MSHTRSSELSNTVVPVVLVALFGGSMAFFGAFAGVTFLLINPPPSMIAIGALIAIVTFMIISRQLIVAFESDGRSFKEQLDDIEAQLEEIQSETGRES